MAVWALAQGLALGLATWVCQSWRFRMYSNDGEYALMLYEAGLGGLLLGVGGHGLLRLTRSRVPAWSGSTLAGSVIGTIAGYASGLAVAGQGVRTELDRQPWFSPLPLLVFAVSLGIVLAAFQAAALWKFLRPRSALLWLAGAGVFSFLAALARWTLRDLENLRHWEIRGEVDWAWGFRVAVISFAGGLLQGAGTAWLLDRCVFKREAETGRAA